MRAHLDYPHPACRQPLRIPCPLYPLRPRTCGHMLRVGAGAGVVLVAATAQTQRKRQHACGAHAQAARISQPRQRGLPVQHRDLQIGQAWRRRGACYPPRGLSVSMANINGLMSLSRALSLSLFLSLSFSLASAWARVSFPPLLPARPWCCACMMRVVCSAGEAARWLALSVRWPCTDRALTAR